MTQIEQQSDDWQSQMQTLRALAQIVRESNLSELEVEVGGVTMGFKAPSAIRLQNVPIAGAVPAFDDFEYSIEEETAPQTLSATTEKTVSGTPVVSPMVGLFYRAPSPSDPPFVEVGDSIEIGQTLGLVETMKVFNEITSEVEGTVLEIRAQSGALVETGDTIMVIG